MGENYFQNILKGFSTIKCNSEHVNVFGGKEEGGLKRPQSVTILNLISITNQDPVVKQLNLTKNRLEITVPIICLINS